MNLARNTLYNLIGLGAPLLAALAFVPPLLHALGAERFGLLALIWALVTYFGLLDLGLGRALTQAIARRQPPLQGTELHRLAGTALALLAGVGVIGAALLAGIAQGAPHLLRGVQDPATAAAALRTLALAVPLVVITSGLRGVLEAHRAFAWVNVLRVPLGLWSFVGPWLVCWLGVPDLVRIAEVLVAGRLVGLLAHVGAAQHVTGLTLGGLRWDRACSRELLQVGGWITVGNLVGPLLGVLDRFVVGAALSASAVSLYATTQELVSKLWVVPGALSASLFPMFAGASGPQAEQERQALFAQALRWLAAAMLPLCAGLALLAPELLTAWLGAAFAGEGTLLLQVFAVSAFINAFAHVPFTLLQGAGAARATALLYCVELPLFLGVLAWVLPAHGLAGAAWVWLARVALDTLALFAIAHARTGLLPRRWLSPDHGVQALGAVLAFGGLALPGLEARLAAWAAGSALACLPLIRKRSTLRVPAP